MTTAPRLRPDSGLGRLAAVVAATLFFGLVSGCSPPAPPLEPGLGAEPATEPAKPASTLDKVTASRKIAIGSGYTVPPMNYLDEAGNHVGFDIDLGRAVADKLGAAIGGPLEVELVRVDSQSRVTFLAAGRVDLTISSMSHTRGREDAIDYAEPPYLWVGKQFYAKRGRFESVEDLIGQRIAVQQGSNAMIAGAQYLQELGDPEPKMMAFRTDGEALLALRQGKVEAFTQDNVILLGLLGEEAADYEPVGPVYSPGLYGIGVAPNDSRWRDAVSFALQSAMQDGTYERIYEAWFGPEGKFPLQTNARPRLPEDAYGPGRLFIWPD
jgi:polar amino acid transport system substrate-binding protein